MRGLSHAGVCAQAVWAEEEETAQRMPRPWGSGAHGACEGSWMLTCNCGVSIRD